MPNPNFGIFVTSTLMIKIPFLFRGNLRFLSIVEKIVALKYT